MKYLLLEPDATWPIVVIGLEAGFPTGSRRRELGEGAYELEPFVAVLKDFGPVSVQGNMGWSKQLNHEREDRFTYNWAIGAPFFKRRWHLLAEINGDLGREPQSAAAPGLKFNLTDEIFVALATPFGLNRHTPDWGIVTQLQVGF